VELKNTIQNLEKLNVFKVVVADWLLPPWHSEEDEFNLLVIILG